MMTLQERCIKFMNDAGVPVTKLCKAVNLSTTALYKWRRGELNLSSATEARIDEHLQKFGY